MLDERYLLHGLDALSRAHAADYFRDGHKGAAIIAAHYFCRENDVQDGVPETIAAMLDANWTHTDLCAPSAHEKPDVSLLGRIATALDGNIGPLRQAGHNVIFPAMALRALTDLPEAATPSRVEGICRLIGAFDTEEDITLDEGDCIADFDAPQSMAEFILAEMLRTMRAFNGRGQGWSGHMLTHGRALIDLREAGWAELAFKGRQAFRLYVKRTRMGPLASDKPRPEHPLSELSPLELDYWKRRREQPIGIGHCFTYRYAFHGLMELAHDSELRQRSLDESYRIF